MSTTKLIALCLLCLATVLISSYLRTLRPEFSLVIILIASVILFATAIDILIPILQTVSDLAADAQVGEYFALLIKAFGICCITKFASGFCSDSGHASLSAKIDLIGRCAITIMGLPLTVNIIEFCKELVG